MANKPLEVHVDDCGDEFVYLPSAHPSNRQVTKVYLDDLGYDPRVPEEDEDNE